MNGSAIGVKADAVSGKPTLTRVSGPGFPRRQRTHSGVLLAGKLAVDPHKAVPRDAGVAG